MFRAGVLLNSGDSIERLAEVDRVIFDKTGTLTLPELDVVNSAAIPADVFSLAGQLALASHHPVAVASGARLECEIAAGRNCGGAGAGRSRLCRRGRGEVGQAVILPMPSNWRRRFWRSIRKCPPLPSAAVTRAMSSRSGRVCVPTRKPWFRRCRPAASWSKFSSGDREPAVRSAAHALGISEWRADVNPADKIARIEDLKRQGFKVMMIATG